MFLYKNTVFYKLLALLSKPHVDQIHTKCVFSINKYAREIGLNVGIKKALKWSKLPKNQFLIFTNKLLQQF